jgi:hypothetical protein
MKIFSMILTTILLISGCGGSGGSSNSKKPITSDEIINNDKVTKNLPIVIIGPSTVYIQKEQVEATHYKDDSECILYGWGELLPEFAKNSQDIYNYAQPGASAGRFTIPPEKRRKDEQVLFGPNRDHYWAPTKQKMQELKEGILLIQFGGNDYRHLFNEDYPLHEDNNRSKPIIDYNNDGVGDENDRVARDALVEKTFKDNIKFYIKEARSLNFTPILITTPSGRKRDEGETKLKYSREPFPTYMKELGESEGVRVLDLNKKSVEEYESYTDEQLREKFADCKNRWSGRRENTHYEKHGAREVASWIKELACEEPNSTLCKQFK